MLPRHTSILSKYTFLVGKWRFIIKSALNSGEKMTFLGHTFMRQVSFVKFCGHFWSKTPRSRWLSWFSRLNYKVQILIMVEKYYRKTFWFYLFEIKYEIDRWKNIFTPKIPFLWKNQNVLKNISKCLFPESPKILEKWN